MRLDAYYYGFDPTGEERIDRILSAVACAGKAYHHTSAWGDEVTEPTRYASFLRGETPIEWIQNAAADAAAEVRRLHSALEAVGCMRMRVHGEDHANRTPCQCAVCAALAAGEDEP